MLDSIYHMTLKLIKNHISDVKAYIFPLLPNVVIDITA